ncbi:MAG: hypothetical protein ACXABD_08740, partial [Candidatus Thorarchaeota archaeon]
EPDATFIGAPDATITRNLKRWNGGFGYGGKLAWGDGSSDLLILDSMPNACGMLIGGLETLPDLDSLLEKVNSMLTHEEVIDGIPIQWDFAVGNHFIDLFRYKSTTEDSDFLHNYAFIIHGSVPELKGDNYVHKSKMLEDMVEKVNTPYGDIHMLAGDDAKQYLSLNNYACELSKKKRLRAAEELFGDFVEISNPIHQGLISMNEHLLGCQDTKDISTGGLFPIALRSDLPAYLVQGHLSYDDEVIENLGFTKRAEKYGVMNRLLEANILPHGGGYGFPSIIGVSKVIEMNNETRYFVTELATGQESEKIFSNPREIQFSYRGKEVLKRTLDLGLCSIVAHLIPRTVLKV